MGDCFLEFDKKYSDEVENFITSTSDVLYLHGPSGMNKYEIVENAVKNFSDNFLIFQHFCFEFTTINDILLNLYDGFREYIKEKNITLKKSIRENFEDKIVDYFNNCEFNSIIVINNFNLVKDTKEIYDFLFYIAGFSKLKLILISNEKILYEGKRLKFKYLEINDNSFETYCRKIAHISPETDPQDINELYDLTQGKNSYLELLRLLSEVSDTPLASVLNEYKNKEVSFVEFLLNKAISLLLGHFYTDARNISILLHPVTSEFLSEYSYASQDAIDYLIRKMFVINSYEGLIMRRMFKNYFTSRMSLKEKVDIYSNLIAIYEAEIVKSPKIRILRLSRESMRKLLSYFRSLIPAYDPKKIAIPNDYTYLGLNIKPLGAKDTEKPKSDIKKAFEIAISEAETLISKYQYQTALNTLIFASKLDLPDNEKPKILSLISFCYQKLGDQVNAIATEESILNIYKKSNDIRQYLTEYKIARIYKNSFNYKDAKEILERITVVPLIDDVIKFEALMDLYEIKEHGDNGENILEEYLKLIEQLETSDKGQKFISKCSLRIANLYDAINDTDSAVNFYNRAIRNGISPKDDNNAAYAYLALADIYEFKNSFTEANEYLQKAMEKFDAAGNFVELFDIHKKLASYFEYTNPEKSLEHYNAARNCAIKLEDDFKLAYSYAALGDIFYNTNNNETALDYYLKAKKLLQDDKKNLSKILSRIEDMKLKMSENSFVEVCKQNE